MFTVDIKTNEPACALLVDSGKTELFRLEHNEEGVLFLKFIS